ncbi:hypothetical protein SprV_0100502400 [Sparganum proliferum]
MIKFVWKVDADYDADNADDVAANYDAAAADDDDDDDDDDNNNNNNNNNKGNNNTGGRNDDDDGGADEHDGVAHPLHSDLISAKSSRSMRLGFRLISAPQIPTYVLSHIAFSSHN